MMQRILSIVAACVIVTAFSGIAAEPEKEQAAVAAAEKWVVLVDS